ncbi:MAG: molybdopterin-dependent oxidoreductase [Acidimicrobiia bacterium]|nr:molybdopterin-dependent oxidoreductase [Acidimicrobiia bacterium]
MAGRSLDVRRATLPPGQSSTRRFPLVGERDPAPAALDEAAWRLEVSGLVERAGAVTLAELRALARDELRCDIHCVTGWSRLDTTWTGVALADLLAALGASPAPGARFVRFEAYSERRHDTSLDIVTALEQAWIVHELDGEPLPVSHGGPVRVVAPGRYFYKSCKWIHRLELLADDRPGYWERTSAYHPVGDPTHGDQRFLTGSVTAAQLGRFLAATDYAKYAGRPLVGVDLRAWKPSSRQLDGLALKGCDLRRVDLAGASMRGVNLSLSDLRGADLRRVDLEGGDLEGADLRGADLRGASVRSVALTATRLADPDVPARVDGADFTGSEGLLEAESRWLAATGFQADSASP